MSLSLYRAWCDRDRAEFIPEKKTGIENPGEICDRQNNRITNIMATPTVVPRLDYLPPLTCSHICITSPGQSKGKGRQKNHKDIHGIRTRKKTEREERLERSIIDLMS